MQDFILKYFQLSALRKRTNFAEKSSPDSSSISYPAGIYLLKVKIETLDYGVTYVQS